MLAPRTIAIVGCVLLGLSTGVSAQRPFFLNDGDRVLFYGDSISEVAFYDNVAEPRLYTTYVETFAITRFPERRLHFINSAWSGDTVYGGSGGPIDHRLRRDVLPYKPTVMTIMLGTNDAQGAAFDLKLFSRFSSGYEHILDVVQREIPGIRLTLLTPTAHDDVTQSPDFQGGYNAVLVRYGAFVKERGESLNVPVVDMNAPLIGLLTKARTSDLELARKMIPDRTHPGPAGQLAMAAALLKAWNAPRTVSDVEIDAANHRVVHADNTSIAGLNFGESISWEQTDKALPFPIDWNDTAIAFAARTMNIVEEFNQEPLRATSLTAARYKLSVDGEEVHSFSREELAAGVNLALFDTPMLKQAWRVYGLTLKRNDVHFGLWRRVQVPLEQEAIPEKQAALTALTQLEEDVVEQQRAAAQPKTHRFELIPD